MLEEIKKKVQEKVNQSNDIIIVNVINHLMQNHGHKENNSCKCNYCKLLSVYVSKKKILTKVRRYTLDHDILGFGSEMYLNNETLSYNLIKEISTLKEQKDKVKTKIKLKYEDNT